MTHHIAQIASSTWDAVSPQYSAHGCGSHCGPRRSFVVAARGESAACHRIPKMGTHGQSSRAIPASQKHSGRYIGNTSLESQLAVHSHKFARESTCGLGSAHKENTCGWRTAHKKECGPREAHKDYCPAFVVGWYLALYMLSFRKASALVMFMAELRGGFPMTLRMGHQPSHHG